MKINNTIPVTHYEVTGAICFFFFIYYNRSIR
nr:MAG TPA: hypothetical protein [Caudoviricetes sp.]